MLRSRLKTPGRLAFRILLGTGVYVAIVALAAPLPAAAGLMLTFPALNGLAFFFSEDGRAAAIARTMIWMPVVNGVLSAAYVALFLLLTRTMAPALAGWGLAVAAAIVWYAWVTRPHVRAGIEDRAQTAFALATTLAGLALAAATIFALAHFGLTRPHAGSPAAAAQTGFLAAIADAKFKIALFAATLALFVAAIQYYPLSDATRGILAGLPIVTFGGLLSIGAGGGASAALRMPIFLGMAGVVWLGPAIAMWFIYLFSRYLTARKKRPRPATESLARFSALLAAWAATFAVILAVAWAAGALSG